MSDYSLPTENETQPQTQNFQLMPEDQTNLQQNPFDTSKLEVIKNQPKPKTTALVDIIKRKKGLYAKIKIAYHKKIDQDIDNGKKGLLDMDKFIYDLIEKGLKV